jgi:hypothetical protein
MFSSKRTRPIWDLPISGRDDDDEIEQEFPQKAIIAQISEFPIIEDSIPIDVGTT